MRTLEFRPGEGIVPVRATAQQKTEIEHSPVPSPVATRAPKSKLAAPPKPATSPREVIRLAKRRIKELKAELRRHEALKRELAELQRLIAAAEDRRHQRPEKALRAV